MKIQLFVSLSNLHVFLLTELNFGFSGKFQRNIDTEETLHCHIIVWAQCKV